MIARKKYNYSTKCRCTLFVVAKGEKMSFLIFAWALEIYSDSCRIIANSREQMGFFGMTNMELIIFIITHMIVPLSGPWSHVCHIHQAGDYRG